MSKPFENTRSGEILDAIKARHDAGTEESQVMLIELPPLDVRAMMIALFVLDIGHIACSQGPKEVFLRSNALKDKFLKFVSLYDPVMLEDKTLSRMLDNLIRDLDDAKKADKSE